jgi:thiol:disulfide interchange protein DsbD
VAAVCVLFAAFHALPSAAVELLPPHEAFALSARALDPRTLEARFDVVDGYYLYRDKLKFKVAAPEPVVATAELPPGKMKHDDFFGDVETYRGRVVIRILLSSAESGKRLTLETESQGCADAGVCYPPQRQTLTLDVPLAGAGPSATVAAPIGRPAWLK